MFNLPHPSSHFGSGRNSDLVKSSAPWWPAGRLDVDKLLRSTLDALGEAGLWHDASQVVQVVGTKQWTTGAAGANRSRGTVSGARWSGRTRSYRG